VKTVVLFFTKGKPTEKVWYYQLDPGRSLGKTNPLNDADMQDFLARSAKREDSDNSWTVPIGAVEGAACDLSVKNPNKTQDLDGRTPIEILDAISRLDRESQELVETLRTLL
jgi:type I restriction enzyme M protein